MSETTREKLKLACLHVIQGVTAHKLAPPEECLGSLQHLCTYAFETRLESPVQVPPERVLVFWKKWGKTPGFLLKEPFDRVHRLEYTTRASATVFVGDWTMSTQYFIEGMIRSPLKAEAPFAGFGCITSRLNYTDDELDAIEASPLAWLMTTHSLGGQAFRIKERCSKIGTFPFVRVTAPHCG